MVLASALMIKSYRLLYERVMRPLIFRQGAQEAHTRVLRALRWADGQDRLQPVLRAAFQWLHTRNPVTVGGVEMDSHFILAAGFVKGDGFDTEAAALQVIEQGHNIIPGWRSMPHLVGLVEFGSFTRWPRVGNPGRVMWREAGSRSTQNRVGLKNPGAKAAAAFLSRHAAQLPPLYGINIAPSPGITSTTEEQRDVLESLRAFIEAGLYPAWFTLNLSCPNTEDDPSGHQTEDKTRQLCKAVVDYLQNVAVDTGQQVPLWVKVSPGMATEQYRILMKVFHEVGVKAAIATNTLGAPTPDDPAVTAGVGGGLLHQLAVEAAAVLMQARSEEGYDVDVIGCGGVLDARTTADFSRVGVSAMQYWSALVYRGPMAATVIAYESTMESKP